MRAASMVLLLCSLTAHADEPSTKRSTEQIRNLVEQLVSPNPPPITGDEDKRVAPDYRLPDGFDRSKQKLVADAWVELRKTGKDAFPCLIEKWDDKRYSMTMFHRLSEYSHNVSVGRVCQKIVFDQLQPYSVWPFVDGDPRGKPKRPSYPSKFLNSREDAMKWWDANKHKSLFEIQVEVLDWVIAEEEKNPGDFSDKERDFLSRLRAELKRRGEMPPGNYDWMQHEL